MNIKNLRSISFLKTIKFNCHYFGLLSIFSPSVILSKNVKLDEMCGSVNLVNRKGAKVKIGFGGNHIIDEKFERTIWANTGQIIFDENVNIGKGTRIVCGGKLYFGKNVSLTGASSIICNDQVSIGDDSIISWDCLLMDTDFHKIYDVNDKWINEDKKIMIDNHVWIGCGTKILKGAYVPKNSIIAAGSIVTKTLSNNNAVYISGECKKRFVNWER